MGIGPITSQESAVRQRVIEKLWVYLDDNFHKFTDANKIKILSSICAKSMPQIVEGNYKVTKLDKVKIDDKELEYPIGNRIGQLAQHTQEVTATN